MIHGFEFRYILLDDKFRSFIKDPQHEYNITFSVGSIVIPRNKAFLELPGGSPAHLYIWSQSALYDTLETDQIPNFFDRFLYQVPD